MSTPTGDRGFDEDYWTTLYAQPQQMDGVFNATEHALYARHALALEGVDVSSLIDLGFGPGHLFQAFLEVFMPHTACGIEPSAPAFEAAKSVLAPVPGTEFTLLQQDLETWATAPRDADEVYDLGLCTSVLQYLDDDAVARVLPAVARHTRYLYMSVPTDRDLARQADEDGFVDPWAIPRPRQRWLDLIAPSFTIVGNRILESRHHFPHGSCSFEDELYRF